MSQFRESGTKVTLSSYFDDPGLRVAGRLDYDSEGLLLLTDNGRLVQKARKVEALRLPMVDGLAHFQPVHLADHVIESAEAQFGHQLTYFFGDKEEIVYDVLRLTGEKLAQFRVLGRHTHGAGIQMTFAHHDTADSDQSYCGKGIFLRAEHGGDNYVAAGA